MFINFVNKAKMFRTLQEIEHLFFFLDLNVYVIYETNFFKFNCLFEIYRSLAGISNK